MINVYNSMEIVTRRCHTEVHELKLPFRVSNMLKYVLMLVPAQKCLFLVGDFS